MKERINIPMWYWWVFVLIQSIPSTSLSNSFMQLCNQTFNILSSDASIIYTPPTPSSLCCNITLVSDSSDQIIINIFNLSTINPSFKISNKQFDIIKFNNYFSSNRTYLKSDMINLPIVFSLCQFNLPSFEIVLTNLSKESTSKLNSQKNTRKIGGGFVITTIVFGLLLIIGSVSLALVFVYFRRKHQRRRQFTYSLESTSDDWEPSGTGYHLFDNWTNNRRRTENNIDNINIDANEHMPIATNMTNR